MENIFRQIKSRISFRQSDNLNYPAHIHDDIELIYIKHGTGTAWCDGTEHLLSDNTWFMVFPNQVHRFSDFTRGEYFVLILKSSDLLRFEQIFMTGVPINPVYRSQQGEDSLLFLLNLAFREYQENGYSDVIAAYLTALFGKLLPFFPIKKIKYPKDNVLKILQYCADHYTEELTVEMVAQNLCISRSCVSHIFGNRISMRFCDYINSLRLTKATEILNNPNYSITEAANISGFPTIRTFNRVFQKHYGMTPSAYRKIT